jgi:hypothetical protein
MSRLPTAPLLYGSTIPTTPTTPTTTTPKTDWVGIGTTLLNFGSTIFGASENRKNAQAQADALIKQGYSQVEVAKIMLEAERVKLEGIKAGGGAKTGSNTLLIGLGVGGAVVIAIIIFAVTRKKT